MLNVKHDKALIRRYARNEVGLGPLVPNDATIVKPEEIGLSARDGIVWVQAWIPVNLRADER